MFLQLGCTLFAHLFDTESTWGMILCTDVSVRRVSLRRKKQISCNLDVHREKDNRIQKNIESLEAEILKMEEDLEIDNKKLESIVLSDSKDKNILIAEHYKNVGQKQNLLQQKYEMLEQQTKELEALKQNL